MTMAEFSQIIVGYSNTSFVVVDGEIQSALIGPMLTQPDETEIIRVLLMTDGYQGYYHEKVVVSGTKGLTVVQGGMTTTHQPREEVVLTENSKVSPSENGKIRVVSLKRSCGTPVYRGTLEVKKTKQGMTLVNEVALEEYLYGVVPSEMPTNYHVEALKAQAVCARSYAKEQIRANRLHRYGAHVDDSVAYQVYNNIKGNDNSERAVNETKEKVAWWENQVATTYFYSTSCGSSSSSQDVWYTKKVPYLSEREGNNLDSEASFHEFISGEDANCYDYGAPWYRWQVTLTEKRIREQIKAHINQRYKVSKSYIRVKKGNRYVAEQPGAIGKVEGVRVIRRGKSGIVKTIEIEGSKKTIRVYSEYNVRLLLAGKDATYQRKDQSNASGLTMLPSAFFEVKKEKGKFVLNGGGFGHGVGMSQCGADGMAKMGKSYLEIIAYYYPGTNVLEGTH